MAAAAPMRVGCDLEAPPRRHRDVLALAERFLHAGSQVIICGRREEKLREAQARCPALAIRVCDVAKEGDRVALARWASTAFPRLNMLVNNAGESSQREVNGVNWPVNAGCIRL